MQSFWRKCSSCKSEIPFSTQYFVCSVSTCTAKRTNYVFCTVNCFERHLPGARHKEAFAMHEKSPSAADYEKQQSQETSGGSGNPAPSSAGQRRIIRSSGSSGGIKVTSTPTVKARANDVLIVASKLKDYIRANSDFNTSGDVMARLSDFVRLECDRAIENARADGRKTVMARDFKK